MNLIKNYKTPTALEYNGKRVLSQKEGGTFSDGESNIILGGGDMYKLVDCVFENSDNQQFVVPFVCIDPKNIHMLPNKGDVPYYLDENDKSNEKIKDSIGENYKNISRGGMMSTLTDNRYGQVIEYVPTPSEIYKYRVLTNKETKKDEIIREEDITSEYTKMYTDIGLKMVYFNRDDERKPITITPIEPMAPNSIKAEDFLKIIFGDESKSYKLVSMRLYSEKCAEQNGKPIEGTWKDRQREIGEKPNFFNDLTKNNANRKNIIVKYE